MGADLILGFVEIARNKEPKWLAAEKHLERLTDEQLSYVLEACTGQQDEKPRLKFKEALDLVIEVWGGYGARDMTILDCAKTKVLLAADTSWGDPVESVDSVELFRFSGMARAAGFLRAPKLLVAPKKEA